MKPVFASDNPTISTANNRFDADQGYGYDAAGNLTTTPYSTDSTKNFKYEYDAENRQVSFDRDPVATPDEKDAVYVYDGDGRRVKKVAGGETTVFVYDAVGKLVAEYSEAGSAGWGTSYLTSDALGTPRIVTGSDIGDGNKGVRARHDYLPFGEELSVGRDGSYAGDNVRQKFTSYERDNETGLDFAQARYYAHKLGRFTTIDPIIMSPDRILNPQEINLYAYCQNNPLIYTDPDGKYFVGRDGRKVAIWAASKFLTFGRTQLRYGRNATASVRRMVQRYNAAGSEKAMSDFLETANNRTKTHLKLLPSKGTYTDPLNKQDTSPIYGYTQPHDKNGKPLEYSYTKHGFVGQPEYIPDGKGNMVYKEVTITVYQGSLTRDGLRDFPSLKDPQLTKDEALVLTTSHEIRHAINQEGVDRIRNGDPSYNVEKEPKEFHMQVHEEIIRGRH